MFVVCHKSCISHESILCCEYQLCARVVGKKAKCCFFLIGAYCTFRLQFEASFTFPEIHDSLFDKHYQFAEIIGNLIHDNWNWDKELDRLKEKGMHNTHNNVSRILSMVEEIRRRLDNSQS
jgi:hypothetical protein